jgi:hypothetical protein
LVDQQPETSLLESRTLNHSRDESTTVEMSSTCFYQTLLRLYPSLHLYHAEQIYVKNSSEVQFFRDILTFAHATQGVFFLLD